MTEISSPLRNPLTIVESPDDGIPSTRTVPAGSAVVAWTTTFPSVAAVVRTPYRDVPSTNPGYMPTPSPEIVSDRSAAAAAAGVNASTGEAETGTSGARTSGRA